MKAFITVIGRDKIGIIAAISGVLAENHVNIEDISQTILQGNFTMIMAVSFSESAKTFEEIADILKNKGAELGIEVSMRNREIFEAMHQI